MEVTVALGEDFSDLRNTVRQICKGFPGEYWRKLDDQSAYPTEFVAALTEAGFLGALIPEEYGGSGLPLRAAAVILEEINANGCSASPAHAQMYIMGTLLRHGNETQKRTYLPEIAAGRLRLQAFGVTEPNTGSDTTQLKTRAERQGDVYVVNGQKVWTSGAHDADVILTFVRTDPEAAKHRGISVLMIPTDAHGVVRRPFPSVCNRDDVDFNEVFFSDVEVPAENLIGPENDGWRVANGSLGHERNMLWLSYADRLQDLVDDFVPRTGLDSDRYATMAMDLTALRLLGSVALARAARGGEAGAELSVLKLLGSETGQTATEHALSAVGADGLTHPAIVGPWTPLNLDAHSCGWFERYLRSFAGTIAGGTSEIQRNIIAQRLLGLPRN
jgi:alkylation response protein AidB-like acyl-CoA dehydrogenase